MAGSDEPIGDRVKAIREAWGEKQPAFAQRLTAAAARLGLRLRYDNTMVSKMEVGRREVTLDDVTVIASVDREKRGKEWLAWGESRALLDPRKDRGLTAEEEQRALSKAAEESAKRTGKAGRRRA